MFGRTGTSDQKSTTIAAAPLFARCSRNELKVLASEMDEVDVAAGQVLIHEGRQSNSFYVIASGAAEVTIQGKVRARLEAGDFFGEISMIERTPATATVTATENSRLLVMSRQQFRDAVRSRESITASVFSAMADRLRQNADVEVEAPGH